MMTHLVSIYEVIRQFMINIVNMTFMKLVAEQGTCALEKYEFCILMLNNDVYTCLQTV